jgi:hypothetical protein
MLRPGLSSSVQTQVEQAGGELALRAGIDSEHGRRHVAHSSLSPRAIDAHLRSIYSKLGIASRAQLREADLGEFGPAPAQR